MLGSVRGLIACCFPTINYYLQLTESLLANLLLHLAPISCAHWGGNRGAAPSCSRKWAHLEKAANISDPHLFHMSWIRSSLRVGSSAGLIAEFSNQPGGVTDALR